MEARRVPSACVASPHHLASAAGLAVLADGGNALDAAVATNLVLAVVMPYACGLGGDLFAIVWDGEIHAYNGSGRAPGAATLAALQAACGTAGMPVTGPLTVTVPGAVEAWFTLLERFGTRTFAGLAATAIRYAAEGFGLGRLAAAAIADAQTRFTDSPEWLAVYGGAVVGRRLLQPGIARTLRSLGELGPEIFYRGEIGRALVAHLRSRGGLMDDEDLATHRGEWVTTMTSSYRDVEVHELPPNSQGVTALEALNIIEGLAFHGPGSTDREHLHIEAVKLALADRDAYLTDPRHMDPVAPRLESKAWAASRRGLVDAGRAAVRAPGRVGAGGTVYLCAADAAGMCVSLIQSNYVGFGSGETVPEWGVNLQNRGAYFSLDPDHANVVAPGKRTLHTLMPALGLRDGGPWVVFGTMGADGQAQTQVQVLTKLVDDSEDLQRALHAPRWRVSPGDWSVLIESRFGPALIDGLRARGHRVEVTRSFDAAMGHAHAILFTGEGYAVASDPRSEGAALGL